MAPTGYTESPTEEEHELYVVKGDREAIDHRAAALDNWVQHVLRHTKFIPVEVHKTFEELYSSSKKPLPHSPVKKALTAPPAAELAVVDMHGMGEQIANGLLTRSDNHQTEDEESDIDSSSDDIAKLAWLSVHHHSKFAVLDQHLDVMVACDAEEIIYNVYDSDSDKSYVAPHSARVDEDGDIFMDNDVITTDHDEDIVSEHMPPSSPGSSVLDTSSSLKDMITPCLWTFLASFDEEHVWTILTDFARGIGTYNQIKLDS
ncbi:hypothetical protein Hypma_002030 [Hypsizygus marmoreus]|uniref:Uncharacterized protein n=1 Tax=Hypsizygus marmoreus TaxID=39966 RepID=A0A369J8V3_HYPMA|nr:hypothetical protein Hypma_002030 [Hypsizygus marmoreus]